LDESYLPRDLLTSNSSEDKISVGQDEYYVLGDNRNASKDSRSFGAVNASFITGKVLFRGWPLNEITVFNKDYWPKYQQSNN
jgi:signal peptidase I